MQTEYIMNKMIKRQDIVPPWIEKQQELVKAADMFRKRLRSDWRRHAARVISSRGGTLQERMARAEAYARAEEVHNPRRQVKTLKEGAIPAPEQAGNTIPVTAGQDQISATTKTETSSEASVAQQHQNTTDPGESQPSTTRPFRDPSWEALERSYWQLSIANLNALTRSYNLMAPELAKKGYFSLRRELDACYADVAPQLAETIKERATKLTGKTLQGHGSSGSGGAGFLAQFGQGYRPTRVYESQEPHYGLKEMWRDLWRRPEKE
jgi:hypothetical protein